MDSLVGADEARERLGVEPTVGVLDERQGERIDARVALERARRELRELAVEAPGEVVHDLAELLVDDREVVHEPLGRRRDRVLGADGFEDAPLGGPQGPGVLAESPEERLARVVLAGHDTVRGRKSLCKRLQRLDAVESAPYGLGEREVG